MSEKLQFSIGVDLSDFEKGLDKASQSIRSFADRNKESFEKFGKSMVNIQLREKSFKSSAKSREISSLIYDALITKYNNNDFAMQIMHNGQLIDTPFTPYVLGRFLVNNSEKTLLKAEGLAEQYPFLAAKQLFVDTKNGKVYYGKEVHTLSDMQNDPQLKEDFIQYIINNQHWAMDKEWLFNGMRDNLLGSKVTATSYFNKTGSEKLSFIPGELEFDKSDFGLIQSCHLQTELQSFERVAVLFLNLICFYKGSK